MKRRQVIWFMDLAEDLCKGRVITSGFWRISRSLPPEKTKKGIPHKTKEREYAKAKAINEHKISADKSKNSMASDYGVGACMHAAQLYTTLCDPTGCSPLGSYVHGISQARILEWCAISSSGGSSWPRHQTHVSSGCCIGRQILYHWATRVHVVKRGGFLDTAGDGVPKTAKTLCAMLQTLGLILHLTNSQRRSARRQLRWLNWCKKHFSPLNHLTSRDVF